MKSARCLVLFLSTLTCIQPVDAAERTPAVKDTVVLQRVPVPGSDREMGMGIAEFSPNASKPRHKATGSELAYVPAACKYW
jgi:hypothetical protein